MRGCLITLSIATLISSTVYADQPKEKLLKAPLEVIHELSGEEVNSLTISDPNLKASLEYQENLYYNLSNELNELNEAIPQYLSKDQNKFKKSEESILLNPIITDSIHFKEKRNEPEIAPIKEEKEILGWIEDISSLPPVRKVSYIGLIENIPVICEKIARPVSLSREDGIGMKASCMSVLTSESTFSKMVTISDKPDYKEVREKYFFKMPVNNTTLKCDLMGIKARNLLSHVKDIDLYAQSNKLISTCFSVITDLEIEYR